jgi:hypothetical protein
LSPSLWNRFKQGPLRRRLRVIILLAAGMALLLWGLWGQWQSRLTVENRSGQTLKELRITFAGETKTFRNVPPGKAVTVPAGEEEGGRYVIQIKLGNGSLLHSSGVAPTQRDLVVLPNGTIAPRPADKTGP